MMHRMAFVFALACLAYGLPAPTLDLDVQTLLADPPAVLARPDIPHPDEEGITVEEVVNVKKSVVVLVHSLPNNRGAVRRALIRESWLQSLNRTVDFALPVEARTSIVVWFFVPLESHDVPEDVMAEAKLHGDMAVVVPHKGTGFAPSRFEEVASSLRWLRVAYHQLFEFVLLMDDDGFLNIPALLDFAAVHKNEKFFYAGGINSFERADADYLHKYYAPFAEIGTIMMSTEVVELLSREAGLIKKYPRVDVTLGHFLMPYLKPYHSPQFIAKLSSVYSEIPSPILINHCDPTLMKLLSKPTLVNGKFVFPSLPAQVEEMSSRSVFVDPHPKDDYPECDSLASGKCNFSNLKMIDELKH